MDSFKDPKDILEDIIEEIISNSSECEWFLDLHKLSELLCIKKEEFFRKLYSFQNTYRKGEPRETRSGFYHTDGEYLAAFLSYVLGLQNVSDHFTKAGIYFSEKNLEKLQIHCKNLIQNSLLKHQLDKETLLLLATATVDYDAAVDSYLDEKFELDFFIQRAVYEYMELNQISPHAGAEMFLYKYLVSLFPKRLNYRDITKEFRDRSYYELYGKFRKSKSKKSTKKSEFQELMEYFDLEDGFTKDDLKKKFKHLLKKYHPDINKNGLQKTQEIIAKYNQFIILLNQRS